MSIQRIEKSAFRSEDNITVGDVTDIPNIVPQEREGTILIGGERGGVFMYNAARSQDSHNNMTIFSGSATQEPTDFGCWERVYASNQGTLIWAGIDDSSVANLTEAVGIENLEVTIVDPTLGGKFKFNAANVADHDGVNNFNGWTRIAFHQFTDNINMQSHKITQLLAGTEDTDAANLKQLVDTLGSKVQTLVHFGSSAPTDTKVSPIWVNTSISTDPIYLYNSASQSFLPVSQFPVPTEWEIEAPVAQVVKTLSAWMDIVEANRSGLVTSTNSIDNLNTAVSDIDTAIDNLNTAISELNDELIFPDIGTGSPGDMLAVNSTNDGYVFVGGHTPITETETRPDWIASDEKASLAAVMMAGVVAAMSPTRFAVVDLDSGDLRAYDFDGSTITQVGNVLNLGTPPLNGWAITAMSDTRIAIFDGSSGELQAYDFDGTNWATQGAAGVTVYNGTLPMVAMSPTRVVFAQITGPSYFSNLRAYDFDGTNWTPVGTVQLIVGQVFALTMLSAGRVAAHVIESSLPTIHAYDFDGSDWESAGGGATGIPPFGTNLKAMTALNSTDVILYSPNEATIMRRRDNGSWHKVKGFSGSFDLVAPSALSGTDLVLADSDNNNIRVERLRFALGVPYNVAAGAF